MREMSSIRKFEIRLTLIKINDIILVMEFEIPFTLLKTNDIILVMGLHESDMMR